jgi:lipopolysaccharide export system permease protein
MMGVTTTWLGQNKINVVLGLWGLHAAMIGLLVILFYNRLLVFSWRRLFR